jgi:hypothetical protein
MGYLFIYLEYIGHERKKIKDKFFSILRALTMVYIFFFIQNRYPKLTLSNIVNEFLKASYIRLVIFLSISFQFYFFYNDCIFPKDSIFQL